jgi:hypothetical protein
MGRVLQEVGHFASLVLLAPFSSFPEGKIGSIKRFREGGYEHCVAEQTKGPDLLRASLFLATKERSKSEVNHFCECENKQCEYEKTLCDLLSEEHFMFSFPLS